MKTNKSIGRSDALGDFLAVKGITTQWLIEQCEELPTDAEAASTVLEILADLVKSGIALPPIAADMVSAVLLALASGDDARALVGTAPTRGRPASNHVKDRRIQAGACLALMKMNGFPRGISVRLMALAMGMVDREVEEIVLPETTGDWNHQPYLVGEGAETLAQVLRAKLFDPELARWRDKFADICSETHSG